MEEKQVVSDSFHHGFKRKKTIVSRTPTLARASTRAPFLRRQRTTSTCPARAAMCNAVSPRCRKAKAFQCPKLTWRKIFASVSPTHDNWCWDPSFLPAGTLASAPEWGVSTCHCTWECLGLPPGQSQTNMASTTERQNGNPGLGKFCQIDLPWSHLSLSFVHNRASAHVLHRRWEYTEPLSLEIAQHTSLKMERDIFPDGLFLHSVWSWQH